MLVASDTTDISHTLRTSASVLLLSGAGRGAAGGAGRGGADPARPAPAAAAGRRGGRDRADRRSRAAGCRETADADEIGQLTGVLNRMLASLERSRATERRFLADASHELRTPVTALLGNVEYAARHGADAEVLADLRSATPRAWRGWSTTCWRSSARAGAARSSSRSSSTGSSRERRRAGIRTAA